MNGDPDILVVVPTMGDREATLRQAVASITSQRPMPRVLVIAGANIDGVHDTVRGLDVEVLMQRTNGLAAAINEAWEHDKWRSDYTGWLGDDDLLLPGAIATAAGALERDTRASMVHGRCRFIDGAGRTQVTVRTGRVGSWLAGWGMNLLAQPGALYRTSAVRQIGGLDESLRYAMDVDLHLRLKTVGRLASVPTDIAVFRAHEGSLSTSEAGAAAAEAKSVRRIYQRGRRLARSREAAGRVLAQLVWAVTR
jgi:GT2 family glycosyltransferase